ncbi:hypothetical protein ACLIKC_07875, partial [Klebsiella aerogenes]|uniref:hypothetical protein n=1 Tax=Klebsiella aerogenes TaxID=548 RepID=UPI003A9557AC
RLYQISIHSGNTLSFTEPYFSFLLYFTVPYHFYATARTQRHALLANLFLFHFYNWQSERKIRGNNQSMDNIYHQ